jgi:MOSC domain-containing protein YiiM
MIIDRGTVLSVNVGGVRQFDHQGRGASSAIWKSPATGRVAARGNNLEGDDQADRSVHGGPDKAVYAYAIEDLQWWENELDQSLECGQFGENLTTKDFGVTAALVGERWQVGSAVLEVSEPRSPCWKLAVRMDSNLFPKRFTAAGRPGAYLRIIVEGDVGAGDEIRVISKPSHAVTIGEVFRIFTRDHSEAAKFLSAPQLPRAWQEWAQQVLDP